MQAGTVRSAAEPIRDSGCPLLVDVREAARRLGLGRSLTYRLLLAGEIRSVKVGAARRIAVTDLADFVDRLRAAASEEVSA